MPTSVPLQPTITTAGLAAVFNAQSTGVEFVISHIAFGTGQYNPDGSEEALQVEKVRVPIAGGGRISPTQIQIYAIAQALAGAPFFVGEIGFFGDDGATLLAVYSSTATPSLFLSDTVSTSVSYALGLAALPAGSVTVTIDPSASAALLLIGQHVAAADPHPQYVEKVNGVAFYDATLTFNLNAQIIGDDGLVYQSAQANNIGHPPSSSPTWWVPLYNYGDTPVAGLTNANVTLNSTQAAKSHLTLSGALTAPVNVVFPAWQKDWTVTNNTTGAFTVTCKTAAGTGVAVSQGMPARIRGDGTNIIQPAEQIALATQGQQAVQLGQVQARGINASNIDIVSATGTLPASVAGGLVIINGVYNVNLPASASVPLYTQITILSYANGATLTPQEGDTFITTSAGSPANVTLNNNDSLVLVSTGSGWYGVGGTIFERAALDNRYAALAGSSTQLFSAANATAATHVVNRQFGDARYAALAGLATQQFSVAAATASANAVNLTQLTAHGDALSELISIGVTGGSTAVNGIELMATANIQRALPTAASAGNGGTVKFASFASGCFISPTGSDSIITISGASLSTLHFAVGDTAEFVSNGAGSWYLVGGSLALGYAGNEASLLGSNGYKKLPGGLILQWGSSITTGSGANTPTFPIAFPSGQLGATLTAQATGVGASSLGWQGVNASAMNVYGPGAVVINYTYFVWGY